MPHRAIGASGSRGIRRALFLPGRDSSRVLQQLAPRRGFGLLLIVVVAVVAAAIAAGPVTATFEELSPGTEVGPPERGGRMGGGAVDFAYATNFPGRIAVEQCYAAEFCTKPFVISFKESQASVGLWVGYEGRLRELVTLTPSAFSSAGEPLAPDSKALEPTQELIPISLPLTVSRNGNESTSVSREY